MPSAWHSPAAALAAAAMLILFSQIIAMTL
jgi:hypothetical protein